MNLICIQPPAVHPVTLSMMKAHLRVDLDNEDDLIGEYIGAATSEIEGEIGRALVTQQWKLVLDGFSPLIELPLPPCRSVDAISYLNSAGLEQTLPPESYRASGLAGSCRAELQPAWSLRWPATQTVREAVSITFTVGYAPGDGSPVDLTANIPSSIKAAIMELAATRYQWRESVSAVGLSRLPDTSRRALDDYRIWSF